MKKNIFLIVNYNDVENTNALISNIKDYKILDEIIVVDNCSKDSIYQQLKKNENITILRTKKNNGYGPAINFGLKYCKEKYKDCNIFVSNSDIVIKKEEDLKELIKNIKDKKEIAIVAPKINQNEEMSFGWKIPSIIDAIIMNIPKLNRKYEKKKILYNDKFFDQKIKEVEVVSGCFFLTKLSSLEKIDYFDENIFLYYEENIVAYKLKRLKEKIILNSDIEVFHKHSLTINKNINEYKKLKELKKSQYYFYKSIIKSNKVLLFILKITNKIVLIIKKVKVGE